MYQNANNECLPLPRLVLICLIDLSVICAIGITFSKVCVCLHFHEEGSYCFREFFVASYLNWLCGI
jgi:hypothetical protein